MLKDKPRLGIAEIAGFVKEKYGLEVSCVEMDGERDQNVLLTDRDGSEYVLKITNPCEEDAFIEAQNDVLKHLSAKVSLCPELIKDRSGRDTAELVLPGGEKYRTRLVSYLKGKTLGALKDHPVELISDLGSKLGKIDAALQAYENEAFNRDFIWDLANFERVVTDNIGLVNDDKLSAFTRNTLEEYRDIVKPESANLRRSLIHNDANDHNVIVSCDQGQYTGGPEIKGFIDFGDMVYSYTVADPAVAMAYIMPGKDEPLRAAAEFLSAYNKTFRLTDNEVRVIFTMAKMRLALSICIAVLQKKERPDDNYLGISQEPISSIIPVLGKIHPLFAEAVFREACGMDQAKGMQEVLREIKECGREAYPVLGEKLSRENCLVLDLGAGSDIIDGDPENNTASKLGERINERLNRHRKKFGIGRYMEPRILYSSPVFQGEQFLCKQDRTIHLGMDLFAPEGAAVHAPADASVYLFSYNPGELDYGHMIILEHKTAGNNSFYTLYGHLSKKSVSGLSKGKKLKKGDIFAWVGNSRENGGWSPHLHFQVITKLLDYGVDFPGVCKPWERGAWLRLSPDPNIILNIPAACFPVKEAGKEITYEKRKQYFTGNLSLSYRKPLKMVRGWRQYLFDEAGQKYLDSYNNVPHIGHCHPEVTEAVYEQMRLLNTNTRYLNDRINEFAELLTATFPQSLEVCFFLNSASEANELALRLAFTYTGRRDLIVLEGAYHGNTSTLIDISPYKHDGPGGRGAPDWVHKAPQADPYRGEYKYHDRDAGKKYAQYVEGIISDLKHKGRSPAAFIAETCPSVGGQIIFPQGYLASVYKHIRAAGAVCIADEVQTAYGRMGSSFYAFEDQGVVPDIVVLGKPIGNGHPLAAVITTRDIASAFDNGMEFFSTFGGNTVSVAAGRKVLEIVLRDKYMKHAHETGSYLLDKLRTFKGKYPLVGDLRGSGLFLGIELVRDHDSLEPAGEEASYIAERMRERRILLGTDGPYNNVLKIRPPMPFDRENAEILADRLSDIFENDPLISM